MHLSHLLLSLFFLSGFYYLGFKIINFFNLRNIVEKISEPFYQNTSFGLVSFIFIFYPIFFLGFFNYEFFLIISSSISLLGIINILININTILNFLKRNLVKIKSYNKLDYIVYILLILFFLLSISPITSGDSISYHMGFAKYILKNGSFSKDLFFPEAPLAGAGEFLNAFALSLKAYQFTSLINFVGIISIIGILKKFSKEQKLSIDNQNFLYLCIISCPILVFFVSSSKSQLFSISLIFFSYALLIVCLTSNQNKKFLIKTLYLLIIFPIVAVQTKISFSLSLFLIVSTFFFIFSKKIKIYNFLLIFIALFAIGILPPVFWKQNVYDYPFYYFLVNPLPLNIPGFDQIFISIKNYQLEKFPYLFFFPLSLSDLTQFIGFGLFSFFFLLKNKFENKKIILILIFSFVIIYSFIGQKTPRFYLEIYCLSILSLSMIVKKINDSISFKILKLGIIAQSFFVICMLAVGVYNLLPGTFSVDLKKKVLSKYADGYDLFNWANNVLPKDSITLVNHRSFYFAEKKVIYFGMAGNLKKADKEAEKYLLNKITEKKPSYILFFGFDEKFNFHRFDFKNCLNGIFRKKNNVGFYATRNIFNTKRKYYNAYIYKLDSSNLNKCVIVN